MDMADIAAGTAALKNTLDILKTAYNAMVDGPEKEKMRQSIVDAEQEIQKAERSVAIGHGAWADTDGVAVGSGARAGVGSVSIGTGAGGRPPK